MTENTVTETTRYPVTPCDVQDLTDERNHLMQRYRKEVHIRAEVFRTFDRICLMNDARGKPHYRAKVSLILSRLSSGETCFVRHTPTYGNSSVHSRSEGLRRPCVCERKSVVHHCLRRRGRRRGEVVCGTEGTSPHYAGTATRCELLHSIVLIRRTGHCPGRGPEFT